MRLSFVLSVFALLAALSAPTRADTINIYAAASTADALNDILAAYQPAPGNDVKAIYAASSTLARQIQAGADADLYLSANGAWMDELQDGDLIASATRIDLLSNRLVLVTPRMLPIEFAPDTGTTLGAALGDRRLAIANPSGVPAGIYARETLTARGEWDALQDNIVIGDTVRSALTWAAWAEVGAAIVYESDTYATQSVRRIMTYPEDSHSPIRYPLGIIAGSEDDPEALSFYEFLRGPEASEIFRAYGFGVIDQD